MSWLEMGTLGPLGPRRDKHGSFGVGSIFSPIKAAFLVTPDLSKSCDDLRRERDVLESSIKKVQQLVDEAAGKIDEASVSRVELRKQAIAGYKIKLSDVGARIASCEAAYRALKRSADEAAASRTRREAEREAEREREEHLARVRLAQSEQAMKRSSPQATPAVYDPPPAMAVRGEAQWGALDTPMARGIVVGAGVLTALVLLLRR